MARHRTGFTSQLGHPYTRAVGVYGLHLSGPWNCSRCTWSCAATLTFLCLMDRWKLIKMGHWARTGERVRLDYNVRWAAPEVVAADLDGVRLASNVASQGTCTSCFVQALLLRAWVWRLCLRPAC